MQSRCTRKHGDDFPQNRVTQFCSEPNCQLRLACGECQEDYHKYHKLVKLSDFHTYYKENKSHIWNDMIMKIQEAQKDLKELLGQISIHIHQTYANVQDYSKIDTSSLTDEILNQIINQNTLPNQMFQKQKFILDQTVQVFMQQAQELRRLLNNINQPYIHKLDQVQFKAPNLQQNKSVVQIRKQFNTEASSTDYIINRSQPPVRSEWNTITMQKPRTIFTQHKVCTVALSPNGKYIASAGYDNDSIQIWDPISGRQVGESLKGHTNRIYSLQYSKCGNFILSGSEDNTIRQWNLLTNKLYTQSVGHVDVVTGVQYSSDQKYIVSSSWDKTIRLWDVKTGKEQFDKRIQHAYSVRCLVVSSTTQVAFGDCNGNITIWDYAKHSLSGEALLGHTEWVYSVQYSADNKWLLSAGFDQTIRLWDMVTRKQVLQMIGHIQSVLTASLSPDAKYIISGGSDKTVKIWDRGTSKQIGRPLQHHQDVVYSVQWSLDGRYIITAGLDKQIRISLAQVD